MAVRVSDGRCLEPRLRPQGRERERRVTGVLYAAAPDGRQRLVREVRFDGRVCRYRVEDVPLDDRRTDDGRTDDGCTDDGRATGRAGGWIVEDEATRYRPFCHLILERLARGVRERTLRLHRLPGAPPSRALTRRAYRGGRPDTLVALDSCLTATGGLWIEVALGSGTGVRGWLAIGDV